MVQEIIDLRISDAMMASQERDETRVWTLCKRMERLEKVLKQVSVLLSQLTHFSTLAKEKDMLFILNFPTLALITRTGTSKGLQGWPTARDSG